MQCYQEGLTEHPWPCCPASILSGLLQIAPHRKASVITLTPRSRCLQKRVVTAVHQGPRGVSHLQILVIVTMRISGSCSLPRVSDASAQPLAVLHKVSSELAATPGLLAGPREASLPTAKPSGKILCLFTPLLPWRIVSPDIVVLRDTPLPGPELGYQEAP